MKMWFKRSMFVLLVLVLLLTTLLTAAIEFGELKMTRRIDLTAVSLDVGVSVDVTRGRYLFMTRGCAGCHGANGAGKVVVSDGGLFVSSPNLTRGTSSVVQNYQSEDWVRAVRHGVKPNGQPLMVMPSEDYNRLSNEDMAALVAYISTLAPVMGKKAEIKLTPLIKALYAGGIFKDASEKIDHDLPPHSSIDVGRTEKYGAYVANTCIGCHGSTLAGGKIPGAPPSWPAAANLTPGEGSVLARYPSTESFIQMMRTGKRRDGSAVSQVMPFESLSLMSDDELSALYLHLRRLPPRTFGER